MSDPGSRKINGWKQHIHIDCINFHLTCPIFSKHMSSESQRRTFLCQFYINTKSKKYKRCEEVLRTVTLQAAALVDNKLIKRWKVERTQQWDWRTIAHWRRQKYPCIFPCAEFWHWSLNKRKRIRLVWVYKPFLDLAQFSFSPVVRSTLLILNTLIVSCNSQNCIEFWNQICWKKQQCYECKKSIMI